MADTIQRFKIADYLNISADSNSEDFALCGVGFNTLDENPGAQVDTKVYVNDRSASGQIKSYQSTFPFDTDLIKDQAVIMDLYDIGRNRKTGADAERDYVRVELFRPEEKGSNIFAARKFRVAVEVSGCTGGGGETIHVAGNFHPVGDFIDGTFDTQTKTFTDKTQA